MTIKELSEHPERASEEDLKTIENAVNQIKEMGKRAKPLMYGVTLESGRTKEEIAHCYYVETMLMTAILESFLTGVEQEYKDINKFVFNYTDKAFLFEVPISDYFSCMAKLCALGLLEITKEDKYNPSFVITAEGLVALRQQTYANLAQAALFNLKTQQLNDKTLELSKRSVKQNWLMLAVAIASAIAAFVSIYIALCK
jgi:hypothetical protein